MEKGAAAGPLFPCRVLSPSRMVQWYFHLPNFALAALGYTLLARLLLGLVIGDGNPNFIQRFFVQVTDPAVGAVSAVTPRIVDTPFLIALCFVWTVLLRFMLLTGLASAGLLAPAGS